MRNTSLRDAYLVAGKHAIAQTANILFYLGPRLRLPRKTSRPAMGEQRAAHHGRWLTEAHDTHHPIGAGLLRGPRARRPAPDRDFLAQRLPKYLGLFRRVLGRSGGPWLLGRRLNYPDLSLFQMLAGLQYAFPQAMARRLRRYPLLVALHNRVAAQPRLSAYFTSARRIPFNRQDIFRHYPELDRLRNKSKKT